MYSCGPIFTSGNFNGSVKQCKVKEQSVYNPTNAICDIPFVTHTHTHTHIYIYILLHVSTQSCQPHGLIIAKVYNQHNNICSAPPYKVLSYAINGVSHSACVG